MALSHNKCGASWDDTDSLFDSPWQLEESIQKRKSNTFFTGGHPNSCCCGEEGCLTYLNDNFNDRGGNTPDLGSDWVEIHGDWSVSGNQLVESGVTLGARVIVTGMNSTHEKQYVSVVTVDEQSGNCYEVIVNYKNDKDYHMVRWETEADSDPSGMLSLWENIGGNKTKLNEGPYGSFLDFTNNIQVHFTPELFCAMVVEGVPTTPIWTTKHSYFVGGRKVGLGVCSAKSAPGPMIFDDFVFKDEWSKHVDCPQCGCYCSGNAVTYSLGVSTFAAGGCAGFDGLSFALSWNRELGVWQGGPGTVGAGSCQLSPSSFTVQCATRKVPDVAGQGGSCTGFSFNVAAGGGGGCLSSAGEQLVAPISCDCDPFELTGRVQSVPSSSFTCDCCCAGGSGMGPPCGTFYFVVTEV